MSDLLPDGTDLGASGEQAWQALRQHTEWAEDFWIAWLFTGSPPLARELEARMERLLAERGQQQVVLRPRTPAEARRLLEPLLGEETRTAACVWVEIIHGDGIGLAPDDESPPGPWTAAWDWLMMRANERRTALERHLPGGVVFVAPPAFKDRTRRAAPDLWTIRALVLEPALPAMRMAPGWLDMLMAPPDLAPQDERAPDAELALAQAARMRAQGHRADEATALVRAAQGLLARGETAEALRHASEAVEAAGEDTELRARALATLGTVEIEHGDRVAAERHLRAALDLAGERCDRAVLGWRWRCGRLLEQRKAWEEAARVHSVQVERARSLLQREPEDARTLFYLRTALVSLGHARFQQEQLTDAEDAWEEALACSAAGNPMFDGAGAPYAAMGLLLRAVSLYGLGGVRMLRGDLEGAERRIRASITLFREIQSRRGTPELFLPEVSALLVQARSMLGKILLARGEQEETEIDTAPPSSR